LACLHGAILAQGLLANFKGKSNFREVNIRFAAAIGIAPSETHDGILNAC